MARGSRIGKTRSARRARQRTGSANHHNRGFGSLGDGVGDDPDSEDGGEGENEPGRPAVDTVPVARLSRAWEPPKTSRVGTLFAAVVIMGALIGGTTAAILYFDLQLSNARPDAEPAPIARVGHSGAAVTNETEDDVKADASSTQEAYELVVVVDEPTEAVDQRRRRGAKHRRRSRRPAKPADSSPGLPTLEAASELHEAAKGAWARGDAQRAYELAEASYRARPSNLVAELMTVSACKAGQEHLAAKAFAKVKSVRQRTVRNQCEAFGVDSL